jgi:hypothetical protein
MSSNPRLMSRSRVRSSERHYRSRTSPLGESAQGWRSGDGRPGAFRMSTKRSSSPAQASTSRSRRASVQGRPGSLRLLAVCRCRAGNTGRVRAADVQEAPQSSRSHDKSLGTWESDAIASVRRLHLSGAPSGASLRIAAVKIRVQLESSLRWAAGTQPVEHRASYRSQKAKIRPARCRILAKP